MYWSIAVILVMLHGPDGREIDIAVDEVTSVHCKMPGTENKLFADGVNAVINLTDGKYVSVKETCNQVRDLLKEAGK